MLVDFQLTAHSINQNVKCPIHLVDTLEVTCLELLQRVLGEEEAFLTGMQLVFLRNVTLDYSRVGLVEVSQDLKQLFISLVNAPYQVRQLIFFKVLPESPQTVLKEFLNLDGIVVPMCPVDGEFFGRNESLFFGVGVDADEVGGFASGVDSIWLDELLEGFGELLHFCLDRHNI